jgi:hypothetical protein
MRRAFSLFELILVIFLLGIIYTLILPIYKFSAPAQKQIFSLDTFISNEDRIIVYGNCKKVARFLDQQLLSKDEPFMLGEELNVYTQNKFFTLSPIQYKDIVIDGSYQNVCLELISYPNNIIDTVVLEIDRKMYLVGPHKEQVKRIANLEEAQQLLIPDKLLPTNQDKYHNE